MTTKLQRIDLAAAETVAVDCRRAIGPFGWFTRMTAGKLASEYSLDARPAAADWTVRMGDIGPASAVVPRSERFPLAWLRFKATGDDVGGAISLAFVGSVSVHRTGLHGLAAGDALPALDMAQGASKRVYLPDAFDYGGPFGSLHYSAESDATGIATVSIEDGDEAVVVAAMAAGMANITVTATAPIGLTATAAFAVTVA